MKSKEKIIYWTVQKKATHNAFQGAPIKIIIEKREITENDFLPCSKSNF